MTVFFLWCILLRILLISWISRFIIIIKFGYHLAILALISSIMIPADLPLEIPITFILDCSILTGGSDLYCFVLFCFVFSLWFDFGNFLLLFIQVHYISLLECLIFRWFFISDIFLSLEILFAFLLYLPFLTLSHSCFP